MNELTMIDDERMTSLQIAEIAYFSARIRKKMEKK